MMHGARRAVFGFVAITTMLGILPATAGGLPGWAPERLQARDIRIEVAQIVPITVAPYRWTARKSSDGSIVLSGYEPDSTTQASLLAAAGALALDASSIASGAPDGFASDAETALAILALLDEGTADLAGSQWTVTGRVGAAESAETVNALIDRQKLTSNGWVFDIARPENEPVADDGVDSPSEAGAVQPAEETESSLAVETLPPSSVTEPESIATLATDEAPVDASSPGVAANDAPEIPSDENKDLHTANAKTAAAPAEAFLFAARKQGDSWLLGGDAPIDAFQRLVDIHLGTTTNGRLAVVPAPEGFGASALKAFDVLAMLDNGRVLFDGNGWVLNGVAAREDIAGEARKIASDEGFDATISVSASATLGAEESEPARLASSSELPAEADAISESGAEELAVPVAAPASSEEGDTAEAAVTDTQTDVALSEPETTDDATQASDDQAPGNSDAEAEVSPPSRVDFSDLGLSTEPTHPKVSPMPTVTPYTWQAQLQPDGAMDFSGYVPAEAMKRYLDVRSHGGNNETMIAAGAPEGFAGAVMAGLDALSDLDAGRLDFDGGNWSLTGAAESDEAKSQALSALGPFAESWVVAIATPEPPPAPPARPAPAPAVDKGAPDYEFIAEKTAEDGITLSGDVPAAATRAYLGAISGASDTKALTVRPDAPGEFIADAVGGLRALMTLDSGKLVYKDFSWSLSGKSASDTTRAAVSAAVGALPGGGDWTVDVVPPTPLEICVAEVSAFDERNAILFNAGSSRITDDSLPAIDEIAETLKTCPSAVIHVEGHTDSDGDADSNLILSVSRAEAVVDKLVSLGVGESRIYAIGYGESLPIASNDTNDGKRRNRRIVITVSDEGN